MIRLRSITLVPGVGADVVAIAVIVGIVAIVVVAAVCSALNFGDNIGLLVGLFFGALGALHTLFCHVNHLVVSVGLCMTKIQGKNLIILRLSKK